MWTFRRFIAAAGLTVAGLSTVLAGAAWAPLEGGGSPAFSGMRLTVDGTVVASFPRCLGLGSSTEVIETQTAGPSGETQIAKNAGATKVGRIVCERGLTTDLTLSSWRDLVVEGDMAAARKNARFELFDTAGENVAQWHAVDMWPSELTHHFSGTTGREIITFAAEEIARVAP